MNSSRTDFQEKNRRNKRLGDKGELIIIQYEKDKLIGYGMKSYVRKIKHTSKENDNAGYDILSYDEQGKEIHIEVKSTRAKPGEANFFVSANELSRSENDMNYWVYIVFEANTANPKIWKINNPFQNNKSEISMLPVTYKVKIGVI